MVKCLKIDLSIDPKETSIIIYDFIKTYIKNSGCKGVIVGLSGGTTVQLHVAFIIVALGDLKDKRAVDILLEVLFIDNRMNQEATVFALAQIKDQRALDPIILSYKELQRKILSKLVLGYVPVHAYIHAIGELGTKNEIEIIKSQLKSKTPYIRTATYAALVQLDPSREKEFFIQIIQGEEEGWNLRYLFNIVKQKKWVDMLPYVRPYLQSERLDAKLRAIDTLGFIGDRSDLPDLHALLDDTEEIVVRYAKRAIKRIEYRTKN